MEPFPPVLADSDVDAAVRQMRSKSKTPLVVGAAGLGGAVLSFGLHVLGGGAAVSRDLGARGYIDTHVTMKGPFTWSFTARRGSAECAGHVERMFFSSSVSESCFDLAPKVEARPTQEPHELIEARLRTDLVALPVKRVSCRPIGESDVKSTCTLYGTSGAPVELSLVKTPNTWDIASPDRILDREVLSVDLASSMGTTMKTVVKADCGHGLLGSSEGDKLTCSFSRLDRTKAGSVEVTFEKGDAYRWRLIGL